MLDNPVQVSSKVSNLRQKIESKEIGTNITLVPFDGSGAETLERWFENDEEIRQHYYINREITNYQETVDMIVKSDKKVYWRIESEGEFVGFITASGINEDKKSFRIGIVVPEEYRRKRVASRAIRTLIGHMGNNGSEKVIARISTENIASILLFENLGFIKTDVQEQGKSLWKLDIHQTKNNE